MAHRAGRAAPQRAARAAEGARSGDADRRQRCTTHTRAPCGTSHLRVARAVLPAGDRRRRRAESDHNETGPAAAAGAVPAAAAAATPRSGVGRGVAASTKVRATQASTTIDSAAASTTSAQPADAQRMSTAVSAAAAAHNGVALPREREVLRGAAVRARRCRVEWRRTAHAASATSGARSRQAEVATKVKAGGARKPSTARATWRPRGAGTYTRPATAAATSASSVAPGAAATAACSRHVRKAGRGAVRASAYRIWAGVPRPARAHNDRIIARAERKTRKDSGAPAAPAACQPIMRHVHHNCDTQHAHILQVHAHLHRVALVLMRTTLLLTPTRVNTRQIQHTHANTHRLTHTHINTHAHTPHALLRRKTYRIV